MTRPNVVKLVGVDSKNGEINAVYISHELSGYKGKFVPDRPHGEWIVIHNALGETKCKCNQCQHYIKIGDDKNFCPNCGALMQASYRQVTGKLKEGEEE